MTNKQEKIKNIIKDTENFNVINNAKCFLPGDRLPANTAGSGVLAKIQEIIKKNGELYYFLLNIFAPAIDSRQFKGRFKSLLNKYGEEAIILNMGSGPQYWKNRKDIINVDLFAFDEVDIVADASDLPIKPESIDMIINIAMIEHVHNPEKVVSEMHRLLKNNGECICFLPFLQPFHAAPHDFHRWTIPGIRQLFNRFSESEIGIAAGPTSSLLWILQEWLALIFSFGNKSLHDVLFLLLMIFTAPIKLFDLILERFPGADKIAGGFFIVSKK